MSRLPHALLSTLLLVALTACGASEATDAPRPNLLLISLDTLRTDRVGCYGAEHAETPSLDALAARGVVFEQAYTPAPMTLPAHATLMTGLLPPEHGARVNGLHELAEDVPTLAERLSARGYRCGAFIAASVLDARYGLARGFEHYDDDLTGAYAQEVPEGLSLYRPGDRVVDSALGWLADGAPDQSFFAWVHLYDAHYPWYAHGEEADGGSQTGSYEDEVAFLDSQVARLLAFLRERGLEENTIVVALADHGEGLGDHHEIEHAYLLDEEVLHVPWIVAGPGVKPGQRVPALVSLEDFQPTALELLDVAGTGARGRSLAPALRGEEIPSGVSYAETDLPWTAYRWAPQRSLTTADWKYVRTPRAELYDRRSDREGYANLATARKEQLDEMERALSALEAELGQGSSTLAEVGAEELARLASLGYTAGSEAALPDDLSQLADMKERLAAKDLATELRIALAKGAIGPAEHLAVARRLVQMSPETPAFHAQVGEAAVKLGDLETALPTLAHVVELVPTEAVAHYAYGDALQQAGRHELARQHLELALELEPELAAAHVGLGNALRAEGRPDLAAGEYAEALRLRPGYAEAHFNLGQSFLDRGLPEKAIAQLELALEHKPGWGLAHARLANLFLGGGRTGVAVPHFEAAIAAFPADAGLHNDLGVALLQLGRPNEAADRFVAALELQPSFFRPYVNLADLAFEHGRDELARERYEEALRLAPGHPEPTARLARFLATTSNAELRDGPRSLALAQRAVDLSGGGLAYELDTLAAAYAVEERFPEAISTAHRAQQRARAGGDEAGAAAIEQRLALYASGRPYLLARVEAADTVDER